MENFDIEKEIVNERRIRKTINILGYVCAFLTIIITLYVGLWVCLGGGVISIITGFSTQPWAAGMIAWGVVKIVSASFVAWLCFIFGLAFSLELIKYKK